MENIASARIGQGIYTAADAARILGMPYTKAKYWFSYYAKNKLFDSVGFRYHFEVRDIIAVNFLTLIEMYVFYSLKEKKIKTRKIIEAHDAIAQKFNTPYPFAMKDLYVDGPRILFGSEADLITADKKLQHTISEFLVSACNKIDFDNHQIAKKYYPLGSSKSVVVNPENQFGQPVIDGTNILTATLYDYYKGGDDVEFIAKLYNLEVDKVRDAIEFWEPSYSKAA